MQTVNHYYVIHTEIIWHTAFVYDVFSCYWTRSVLYKFQGFIFSSNITFL